jgi:ketosteroid isomerase-like protein
MLRTLVGIVFAVVALAQTSDVQKAMRESEDAWNRGDLETFASYYDDSPQTTFIGREVTHGGAKAILERYRRGYPTREAMGTLTFSEVETRPIADGVVLMTGRFALKRSLAGGGDSSGRFTLIWKRTAAGWKIIHDHTSS